MNVKTFQGSTMAEALGKVKAEIGADAVILHTRSFKRGGVMGIGSKTVVEISAGVNVNVQTRKKNPPKENAESNERASRAAEFEKRNVVRSAYGAAAKVATKAAVAGASSSGNSNAGTTAVAEAPAPFASTKEMAASVLNHSTFELRNEMSSLRGMVESLLQRTATMASARPDMPGQLAKAYAGLISQQVADELAVRVVDDVKAELTPEQLANPAMVREKLTAKLEALVPVGKGSTVSRSSTGNGCRSICLIGPTGVGKTTTIAKLAAAFKLKQRLRVGLITIDTYRIAAVDQLRTYANIIGVPLKVVLTPSELQTAMKDFADFDVVLVDTAGRSPTDKAKLDELNSFVVAGGFTEVHLVLASTCTQEGMEAAIDRFGKIRTDQIIFTKLDEAVSFGVLLNVARRASKTLSYITTGQDVPEHIEVGQPRRLARLILGDKL